MLGCMGILPCLAPLFRANPESPRYRILPFDGSAELATLMSM